MVPNQIAWSAAHGKAAPIVNLLNTLVLIMLVKRHSMESGYSQRVAIIPTLSERSLLPRSGRESNVIQRLYMVGKRPLRDVVIILDLNFPISPQPCVTITTLLCCTFFDLFAIASTISHVSTHRPSRIHLAMSSTISHVSTHRPSRIHLAMSVSVEFITATIFAVIMVLIGLGAIWIVRWQTYFLLRHQGKSRNVGLLTTVTLFLFMSVHLSLPGHDLERGSRPPEPIVAEGDSIELAATSPISDNSSRESGSTVIDT